ncbi:holo-ACP synthase [Insolitispirillum peregrinum]|uniref:holo-ACP synthase n=1 Tax=Insolitispirillum peregrinum TaxID=80876 RepID=UPI003A951B2B
MSTEQAVAMNWAGGKDDFRNSDIYVSLVKNVLIGTMGHETERSDGRMILGIGSDLVDIRRIQKTIERFGERFLQRTFTGQECEAARQRTTEAAYYGFFAKRFAAKEAGAKALGTGIAKGLRFCDFEVISLPGGQPSLRMHGLALTLLREKLPAGWREQIHLSLSDEWPLAQAYVICSAIPGEISAG